MYKTAQRGTTELAAGINQHNQLSLQLKLQPSKRNDIYQLVSKVKG
jgi:hypothetical protein